MVGSLLIPGDGLRDLIDLTDASQVGRVVDEFTVALGLHEPGLAKDGQML